MNNSKLYSILNKEDLSKEEIVYLLSLTDKEDIQELFSKADNVRKEYCGDEIHLRGIIYFSNYCEQDCLYCGLRISNQELTRYRMTKEEILTAAGQIINEEIKSIVLQSGEDFKYDCGCISDIIKIIKENYDAAITLSLGERGFYEYDEWIIAGAESYILKHETANKNLYFKLHNKQSLGERLIHLRYMKAIGFHTGNGNLIGLPGQTLDDIADDILLAKELDCNLASFSPFIPSSKTPFHSFDKADLTLTLKTIAVARLVLKDVHIPSTMALAALDETGREKGLQVGANVLMLNFTPKPYCNNYEIYPGKNIIPGDLSSNISNLKLILERFGRKIDTDKVHH